MDGFNYKTYKKFDSIKDKVAYLRALSEDGIAFHPQVLFNILAMERHSISPYSNRALIIQVLSHSYSECRPTVVALVKDSDLPMIQAVSIMENLLHLPEYIAANVPEIPSSWRDAIEQGKQEDYIISKKDDLCFNDVKEILQWTDGTELLHRHCRNIMNRYKYAILDWLLGDNPPDWSMPRLLIDVKTIWNRYYH